MGIRRALLVGINAYPSSPLAGCINDLEDMLSFARANGFTAIETLRDGTATAEQIRASLRWLTAGLGAGDVALFSYSGHGTQVRDLNGDEPDQRDEVLCPVDFSFGRPATWLSDDAMAKLVASLAPGVNLTVNLDCCQAGTGLRAEQSTTRTLPMPRIIADAAPVAFWRKALRTVTGSGLGLREWGRSIGAHPSAVLLAATLPTEYAADANFGGRGNGAHTMALLKVWRPGMTYGELARGMRAWLKANGFGGPNGQTPTLYGWRGARTRPFLASF